MVPDLARTLADAVRLHQQGQLVRAEALYRRIQGRDPDHLDALNPLGGVAHQQGRDDRQRKRGQTKKGWCPGGVEWDSTDG
jgi:hypothetical protein